MGQEQQTIPAQENQEIDAFKAAHPEAVQSSTPAPAPSGSSGNEDQQKNLQQITEMLQQQTKPRQTLDQPRMNPKMGKVGLGEDIGLSLLGLVPVIGGAVQRAVKSQKEQQIYEAVNVYNSFFDAYESSQVASGGDDKKAKELFWGDPRVQAILGDKKKSKLLAKAWSIDLTNPGKTQDLAYFQGFKRFADLKQATGKMKQVKGMMDTLAQGSPQDGQQQPSQGQPQGAPQQGPQQPQQSQPNQAQAPRPQLPEHLTAPSIKDLQESASAMKSVIEAQAAGEPKTETEGWAKAKKAETGRWPTSAEWDAHHEAWKYKIADQLNQEAVNHALAGDVEGAKKLFDLAKTATMAVAKTPQPTLMGTIFASIGGDKTAQTALDKWKQMQIEMREAYGTGRAKWQMMQVMDDKGNVGVRSAYDIRMAQLNGQNLNIVGAISARDIQVAQRLITEAGPKGTKFYDSGALKGMYDNIGAFDNVKDRAIFARIMDNTPRPQSGLASDAYAWARSVLDQGLRSDSGLSPEGRRLAINSRRLNESMGIYRALSGLPSTDQSLDITLSLVPSKLTPDAETARMQLDSINSMIENMVNVPIIKPATNQMRNDPGQTKKPSLDEWLHPKK